MYKSFLLILALSLGTGVAGAQDTVPRLTGTSAVNGVVRDASTGQPVAGATVQVKDLARRTITDERGGFDFQNLPAGNHTWSVGRLGYVTFETDSAVTEEGLFTVSLLPQPQVLAGITGLADRFRSRQRRVTNASVFVIDTEDIVRSTYGDAFTLIRGRAHLQITSCPGQQARLCLAYRGGYVRPEIVVDDQRFLGEISELSFYGSDELHLVEVLRGAGGVRIFVTTQNYARQLARRGRGPRPYNAIR